MEFGKIENVDAIDWRLPIDDPSNVAFLGPFPRSSLHISFGAPAWNHKEWIGSLYPPEARAKDFLQHYARYFTCIELNTVHYRIPTPEQARRWVEAVEPGFLFCPKMFKEISHARHGLRDRDRLMEWLIFLQTLGSYGGPSFLQLPPHFDYSQKGELFEFLRQWPKEFALALEFRHPSWFQERQILPALTEYLRSRQIGLVITDVAGRRDVLHSSISADFSMLRFIGNNLHPSDFSRAKTWSERFALWQSQGLQRLFLFIHEPDDLATPEMSEAFLNILFDRGWNLRRTPRQQPAQLSLL